MKTQVGETELEQTKRLYNQRAAALERAYKKIEELQKEIFRLENMDHYCGSCGNVIRPSHYADGC